MLNLDTHILLHAVAGTLRPVERRLLTAQPWSVSAIVLWETAKLAQLGRISIDLADPEVVRVLARVQCGRSHERSLTPARASMSAATRPTS
jgi:PIN domain nuclease of toxin-antitoxin system